MSAMTTTTPFSISEQCQAFVEATLIVAAHECTNHANSISGEFGKLCHFNAKRDHLCGQINGAEACAALINKIDPAQIVRNVLSLLAESPDNPGAPVDMGDGDE